VRGAPGSRVVTRPRNEGNATRPRRPDLPCRRDSPSRQTPASGCHLEPLEAWQSWYQVRLRSNAESAGGLAPQLHCKRYSQPCIYFFQLSNGSDDAIGATSLPTRTTTRLACPAWAMLLEIIATIVCGSSAPSPSAWTTSEGLRFELRKFESGNKTRTTSPRRQFIVSSHFRPIPILSKLR
jgi:hypothetical protein